ncbi:hypothetical protein Kpho02_70140 [Kitasatospora phosalacinea]|uniref:Nucleoside 2-deoxyribosyltransferase like n=1 Tax=Kitasatospora phosalacinea TaxID=2065 RepID=A0A9W6V6Y7_9ACTN|nr:hypothetical protein Kpho02_70140 [Kitasatospora phosalacinea]
MIHPPEPYTPDGRPSVYLAGRAVDGDEWREQAATLLATSGYDGTVLDPFPRHPAAGTGRFAAWAPLGWQSTTIRCADVVLFWEPAGPITVADLYSRQVLSGRGSLVVGWGPDTAWRSGMPGRLHHELPWLTVHTTLAATVAAALQQLAALRAA